MVTLDVIIKYLDGAPIDEVREIRKRANKIIKLDRDTRAIAKKDFQINPWDMRMARGMYVKLQSTYPLFRKKSEKDLENWADHFRKLRTIDGYSEELIFQVTEFSLNDSFWKKVILSPANLRDKFERLMVQKASGNNII